MNDLEFVELPKDNRDFDGRFCVDCAFEKKYIDPKKWKEELEEYKQAKKPD
jgi:hypothetical protein